MKLHTLRYSNPLSAILEDFFSIRFKPHQVVLAEQFHIKGSMMKLKLKIYIQVDPYNQTLPARIAFSLLKTNFIK